MNVGFVGLGAMGAGIIRRLLAAGRPVTGWNRTKEKAEPLLAAGMTWADTPRELASASDVVFSMLTDTAAVEAVVLGDEGILSGLTPGSVYIDMSTISPETSRALAAAVVEAGSTMLDAPVSGSMATLERGELSIMVGGDESSFKRARPVLLDVGSKITHVATTDKRWCSNWRSTFPWWCRSSRSAKASPSRKSPASPVRPRSMQS